MDNLKAEPCRILLAAQIERENYLDSGIALHQ